MESCLDKYVCFAMKKRATVFANTKQPVFYQKGCMFHHDVVPQRRTFADVDALRNYCSLGTCLCANKKRRCALEARGLAHYVVERILDVVWQWQLVSTKSHVTNKSSWLDSVRHCRVS